MLSGTNLKHTRALNGRIVLEAIRILGPISRADVARHTELTAQTVGNISRDLLASGLILESERVQEGRGAPATGLVINPDGAYTIGLDLDQDHMTAVLVDLSGTVRQRAFFELDEPPPGIALDLMHSACRDLLESQGIGTSRLAGVGVGLPGPLGKLPGGRVATVVSPKAFPGWEAVRVVDELESRLRVQVLLENNATAAAIGESWYGAGRHLQSFFYLFFGSGLGGGLVVGGHPYEGYSGNAGEIGYFPTSDADASLPLAKRPHHGVYFNLRRLYRMLREAGTHAERPADLAQVYDAKNPVLMHWLEDGASHLAPLLLAIEYLLDPEAIFFGGRLPDPIINDLMERVDLQLPTQRIDGKNFAPALLRATAGSDAAALGVATLPVYEAFAPAPSIVMRRDPVPGRHASFAP